MYEINLKYFSLSRIHTFWISKPEFILFMLIMPLKSSSKYVPSKYYFNIPSKSAYEKQKKRGNVCVFSNVSIQNKNPDKNQDRIFRLVFVFPNVTDAI